MNNQKPPCELPAPYCNIDCPYFYECYPSEVDDFFEDTTTLKHQINKMSNELKEQPIVVNMRVGNLKMEADKNEVALALKTWRLRKNLSQRALAQRWGMSRYTIMRAESAKNITWEMAYRIFAKLSSELTKEGRE